MLYRLDWFVRAYGGERARIAVLDPEGALEATVFAERHPA